MSPLCPFEMEVVRAGRAGHLPQELRDHAASCAECASALELATLFALDPIAEPEEGEAERIWRRGQALVLLQAQRQADQADRLETLDRIGTVSLWLVGVLGLGVVLYLGWPGVETLTPSLHAVAAFSTAALLVGGVHLVGIWRRRQVSG